MIRDNCELLLAIAEHLFRDDPVALILVEKLLKSLIAGDDSNEDK